MTEEFGMENSTIVALLVGAVASALVMWTIQRRRAEQMTNGAAPPPGASYEEQLHHCIDHGRKIEAIKLYREHNGVGLKDAKEAVERLVRERKSVG
jgi:ribosomal protein L7/L12